MHRDSIIVVGADAGALARLVERMNARPGGFALSLLPKRLNGLLATYGNRSQ